MNLDWHIDEQFLVKALNLAQRASCVSLDIFDTALTRSFDSPADVFAETERRLIEEFGQKAQGFAAAREQAERVARTHHYEEREAEEVSFEEIYQELPTLLPHFHEWEKAQQHELNAERSALKAVPDILELTRRLQKSGISYIFVSDMYLPSSFLAEVLRNCGFEGWGDILVSAETQLTKTTGSIWSLVTSRFDNSVIHIGDDEHADVLNPKKHGINTLEYSRARSERRLGAKLSPAVLPFSKIKRKLDLDSRAVLAPTNQKEAWRILGKSLGGIVVGTFISWLADRATRHKIDRLYFCARDGYLIKKAWEAAEFDKKYNIEIHYLNVSRATLNTAAGIAGSTPKALSNELLKFLASSAGKTTVREALERAGLLSIDLLVNEAKATFNDGLAQVIDTQKCTRELESLLQRHASDVFSALYSRLDITKQYFQQEGLLESGRIGIVDMGWHGSMQVSLRKIIQESRESVQLFGFYYGLWQGATGNRYAAGVMESCFASEFLPWQDQPELHQAVALLEQLHSADHGTVIGYLKTADNTIKPEFKYNSAESAQYQEVTRFFQDGVIDTIRRLFNNSRSEISISELSIDSSIAALGAVILSPSIHELNLLGQIGHCATFDHSRHDPIITKNMPNNHEEANAILVNSDWRIGQFKQWWIQADQQDRQYLRDFCRTHLSVIGHRALHQFY